MKKVLYVIAVGICFTLKSAFCQTHWQNIETVNKNAKIFLDVPAITIFQDNIYHRAKFDYSQKSAVCWIKSDCYKDMTAVLNCRLYSDYVDKNFYTYKDTTKLKPFKGQSAVGSLHNHVCETHSIPKTVAINHLPFAEDGVHKVKDTKTKNKTKKIKSKKPNKNTSK